MMFTELIKFEVELNQVPLYDLNHPENNTNKEISVNWKMYDGFDPKGEFYTDSNEFEMQKRTIDGSNWG
jgi:hypothetical protein